MKETQAEMMVQALTNLKNKFEVAKTSEYRAAHDAKLRGEVWENAAMEMRDALDRLKAEMKNDNGN